MTATKQNRGERRERENTKFYITLKEELREFPKVVNILTSPLVEQHPTQVC